MADDAVHVITTKSENLEQTLKDTVKGVMEGLPKDQSSSDSRFRSASLLGGAGILGASMLGSAFGAPTKDPHKHEQIVNINGHPYSKEVSGDSSVTTVQIPVPVRQDGDTLDAVAGITTLHGQALDIITRKVDEVITTRLVPLEQAANTLKTSVKVAQEGVNTLFNKQEQTELRLQRVEDSVEATQDVVNDHGYYLIDQMSITEDVPTIREVSKETDKLAKHNASQIDNLYLRSDAADKHRAQLHKAVQDNRTAQEEADVMAWDRYQTLSNRIEIQQNDIWALKNEVDVVKWWISDNEDIVSKIAELQLDKERLDQVMRKVEKQGHDIDKAMRVIEHVWRELGLMHDSIKDNEVSVDYLMNDSSDSWHSVWTNSNFADALRNAILSTIP